MSRFAAPVAALLLLALLAGCAHVAPDGRRVDIDRLNNAIAADDVGYVRALVRSGAIGVDHSIPAPAYSRGAPLIALAARAAALNVLRFLIQAGADVNARTSTGETPLMLASYFTRADGDRGTPSNQEHEIAARMLVAAGAGVENEPHHYTPLAYAAYQGHDRLVQFLLERGARVDADAAGGYTYVNTPLMMAAIQGHRSTAAWLLRAGADPRVRVHGGHTAAEFARKYNHPALYRLLRCAEHMGPAEALARCQ